MVHISGVSLKASNLPFFCKGTLQSLFTPSLILHAVKSPVGNSDQHKKVCDEGTLGSRKTRKSSAQEPRLLLTSRAPVFDLQPLNMAHRCARLSRSPT